MKDKKVFFITHTDIYDDFGDGATKGAQNKLKLMHEYFGKENVYLCTFPRSKDTVPPKGAITFNRIQTTWKQLFGSLLGCKIYFPWTEKQIVKFINDKNVDLLFIESSLLGRLVKATKFYQYKTVIFYQNIEADYAWNKVKNQGLRYLPSYWASKYNDRCGIQADMVICINARDAKRMEELYHRKADFLLPITFTDVFKKDKVRSEYEREILFLGSLFPPNQLSIEWFIDKVMPKLNNIRLNIVGKGFEEKKEEYEKNENVTVIGSVKELDEYYYKHCAVVIPIRFGAGMKVKTAEAMMYGRKIFASNEALEGYDVEGVIGISRCNSAEDYARAINHYFDNEELKPYEPAVRKLFLNKYETQHIKDQFEKCLKKLLR